MRPRRGVEVPYPGHEPMKLVINVKPPKRRTPHRPTKVEPKRARYNRKRGMQAIRDELKAEGEIN
jgi:hypothetical protein